MSYLDSPTKCIELRDRDETGNGWYGAKRGAKKHKGTDYVVIPGENIYACTDGLIRLGTVYKDSPKMKLVEIKNNTYRVQQMYVLPTVKTGDIVKKGQIIGTAQDVSKFHSSNKMKPHVHVSVWKNGLLTDPEQIIIGD